MSNVSVTTSATLITKDNPKRLSMIMYNASSTTVYIGQTVSLTTADGVAIVAGGSLSEDSGGERVYLGAYYGISTTGTADIRYWERERY